jgi:hypothetical protein
MRIGAFTFRGPLPELHEPHALAMLRPWTDVGSVGALALLDVEQQFGAQELATLARPGSFYDFTRYRPTVYMREGRRELSVPNTVVSFAQRAEGPDLVVVKMLEPHMFGEVYVESVLALLKTLGVRRYVWLGSMYDMVPHTRRLLVTGGAIGPAAEQEVRRLNILPTYYQGPSTLTFQIVQRAHLQGMEAMWCIVHLPQYVHMDEDHVGKLRLMELLSALYDVSVDEVDIERARDQTETIDEAMHQNPDLAAVVSHFEARYEAKMARREEDLSPLPREVEEFLKGLGDDYEAD